MVLLRLWSGQRDRGGSTRSPQSQWVHGLGSGMVLTGLVSAGMRQAQPSASDG